MEYYDEVMEIGESRSSGRPTRASISSDMAERDAAPDASETTKTSIDIPAKAVAVAKEKPHPPAFQTLPSDKALAPGKIANRELAARSHALTDDSNDGTDTEESSDTAANNGFVVDHKAWDKLDVSPELKELFQYIVRYSPSKVHIDYVLQPFIPEFIPAVGDIDAFLKVVAPPLHNERRGISDFIAKLGVETLDEPAGQQSEPALLHMKLRSVSMHIAGGENGGGGTPDSRGGTGASKLPLVPVARQSKDVDKWITEIQQLHLSRQPYPLIIQQQQQQQSAGNRQVADIDALMNEWPVELERTLGSVGFPSAHLDCSLEMYVRLVCGLLDIPIPAGAKATQADFIYALNTLFTLYMAIRD